MPSTITTTIACRCPNDEADRFRQQAERYGLTPSAAMVALIAGALTVEQERGAGPDHRKEQV